MRKLRETWMTAAGLALTTVLGLPLLGACASHPHPTPHIRHDAHASAVRVVVAKGHLHSARCGHYRYRGHWYHLRSHAHSPRCGHVFVRDVWVLRR